MMELSKRRTLEGKNREEGNGKPPRLFSLHMIPIDGCFEDVLQLWPLSSTSTAACRRSSTAASRMSCSSGRCSSSSTVACQVMGVIDLLLWTAEYKKKKKKMMMNTGETEVGQSVSLWPHSRISFVQWIKFEVFLLFYFGKSFLIQFLFYVSQCDF